MIPNTLQQDWKQASPTNATQGASYMALAPLDDPGPVTALATGRIVIEPTLNHLLAIFYGTDTDNDAFQCLISAASPVGAGTAKFWPTPTPLFELNGLLASGFPGLAGSLIPVAQYFADTLVIESAYDGGATPKLGESNVYTRPAIGAAMLWLEFVGCQKLVFDFKDTGGTDVVDMNFLWREI